MAEARVGRGTSVFAKLVTAMLAMGLFLILLVTLFFGVFVGPSLNDLIFQLAREYSGAIAATSPGLEAARSLRSRGLKVNVRYDGPSGSWSTTPGLPSVDDLRAGRVSQNHLLVVPRYYLVDAPQGGAYIFAWNFSRPFQVAHAWLLALLAFMIALVVLTTYVVIRRLLAPLRALNEGVARLGEGQLDVSIPVSTRDEFGRLSSAFNSMVGRVRLMLRDRDQLLVDVSHELRSPLTRMKVALELPPDETQRPRLATDIAEMERMVAELLELERLRSGRGMTMERQDLLGLVHEATQEFQGRQPGVRVVAASSALMADVDREKIRIVLRNLLENAFKYSLADSRPVEVSLSNGAEAAAIRVSDDGVGIPEGDMGRVFEPFFRVDASRSKRTGGYGLGLSICKRVMEAHGGRITVERAGARGTAFVLTFPKRNDGRS
ncbi:MAG TPA: HAMP domain-containing sensor histidine kinase [Gemmatimonadaceae bacterium]|nr:HAMP domain-containing sensor histidine kinase [Gemmatimonadaceae bacterium]